MCGAYNATMVWYNVQCSQAQKKNSGEDFNWRDAATLQENEQVVNQPRKNIPIDYNYQSCSMLWFIGLCSWIDLVIFCIPVNAKLSMRLTVMVTNGTWASKSESFAKKIAIKDK